MDTEYVHSVVNHLETYMNGNVHTNGMENFWCLLPRGSPQNRPVGVTSKPASEPHPGQPFFYLTCGGWGKVFLIEV
jgi:hypothetical protein